MGQRFGGLLLAFAVFIFAPSAFAIVTFDGNAFYFSDSFTTSSSATYTRLLWDAALSMNLTKKGQLMLGWDYNSASFTDNPGGTSTTVAISGMGPKLTYYFDKDDAWSLSLIYDLVLNASESGGSNFTYTGNAYKAEIGFVPQIDGSMYLGLKLNYYQANLTQKITNQTQLSQVSYSRTAIYPSIAFLLRWD